MMSQVKNATGQRLYDASTTMFTEDDDLQSEQHSWEATMITQDESVIDDEEALDVLLQTDSELASCYTAYLDARKRLAGKARFRRFWPLSKTKGKNIIKVSRARQSKTWARDTVQILARHWRIGS